MTHRPIPASPPPPPRHRLRLLARQRWEMVSNTFIISGIVVLLYVGGLYSTASYGRYAARGDTETPAVAAVSVGFSSEPAPFIAPVLAGQLPEGQVTSPVPQASATEPQVTRVVIPGINVDAKVIPVGWDVIDQNGQQVAVWQVAKYAVGQHIGSANPGDGDNIVLAGHVGGFGKVFLDLYYVQPGDQIALYSNGQQYLYTVSERLLVTEEGVSAEQRAQNAQLIAPTGTEMVTLVTCWPPTGADRFTQRVVVRAQPLGGAAPDQQVQPWVIR